ncbi:hypothetical protein NNJEOMEG_02322 [Fundidesulfovibrio magnetotacticus]|uniref:Uncharacterized protein n=1 Tax=Fundidesulfovibrio magnetotacticus TaxID=2730080 RepID=A0A6V8LXU9_9BACT|nr:hypothetical protein [Fundidesulfovibrio magnetotacticus]GFK94477.1 hypothetical protein NNJEOMEG_02322 [Fundidesulfovibrio magnetotacticus]
MSQQLMSLETASTAIASGRKLILAGDEQALNRLPKGSWIAGTIPYFITNEQGGLSTREQVFATDITDIATSLEIKAYDQNSLSHVYSDGPDNGFSFILIPAMSKAHLSFALNAPNYKDFGTVPLIGWIAGVHLDDLGKRTPKVYNGQTGEFLEEGALVLSATLPPGKAAEIGIVNLFEQGEGDTLTFPETGFATKDVLVNGERRNFAAYLVKNRLDTKLPLVADYYGALVNISFQGIDEADGEVKFYAPVFTGIRYKHARPVPDYAAQFTGKLCSACNIQPANLVFSCNCILNYLYSELEGKKTEPFSGPATFGEIAYQLLNQTLVYLEVHEI